MWLNRIFTMGRSPFDVSRDATRIVAATRYSRRTRLPTLASQSSRLASSQSSASVPGRGSGVIRCSRRR